MNNLLIIMTDDMMWDQMHCLTQVHKYIAKTGVMFYDYHVALPLCEPSRATMMTGQYPHNHGVASNNGIPDWTHIDWNTALGRRLQIAGYKVGFFGKFLNSYDTTVNPVVPAGFDQWFSINPQSYYNYNYSLNGTHYVAPPNLYQTDDITARILSFIATTPQPWVIFYWPHCPHAEPTPPMMGCVAPPAYSGIVPGSRLMGRDASYDTLIVNPAAYMNLPPMSSAAKANHDSFWRAMTEALYSFDSSVKQIMDALIAAGQLANTYTFFTSDNGYMLGQHRNPNAKEVSHHPCSRVPLIISGPGVTQGGFCTRVVSEVDLVATIYALAGATSTRVLDGVSLVPLLSSPLGAGVRSGAMVEYLVANPASPPDVIQKPKFYSLVTSDWHYTEYPDESDGELFDRNTDVLQLVNQIGNPAYATQVAQLKAQLAGLKTCSGSACVI